VYPANWFDGDYRTDVTSREYWFGLYKEKAKENSTTYWYDGNNSTYTDWATDEPNEDTTCVRYTKFGFKDRGCDKIYYYTCKKAAGKFYAQYPRL